jgi:hypothetical protein
MSIKQLEYYDRRGPLFGVIACIAVTATAGSVDVFTNSTSWPLDADAVGGRKLRLYADGADVYYAWSDAADTIVDTATGATAGKCQCIPKGTFVEEYIPRKGSGDTRLGAKYLCYKTASAATATLRVSVCSQDLNT